MPPQPRPRAARNTENFTNRLKVNGSLPASKQQMFVVCSRLGEALIVPVSEMQAIWSEGLLESLPLVSLGDPGQIQPVSLPLRLLPTFGGTAEGTGRTA